jgi:hypothetical protein
MTATAAPTYTVNGKAPPPDRRLAQSHRDMLQHGSAIDPKVIKERDA